ncbi:metallophosphoesterase family protein [Pseudonocardia endophytica]|uniref:DNA repair exonuclease SbcCD nuclease subunit n=1 Tax=Pseudonocardia endophytica TaxID=401976 RepID=A0A4R1HQY3_PSEEN|nr:DNA repair exonuclease [Pseudonocardia endophytica]TCK22910.1 DNA repair exonuclease SbcCD nuclease subunit [Pseudonocardia endophytica]
MRLVHAADLHLDSPLRGLARLGDSDLADTLRGATRRACENLVDQTIAHQADALLLAGDVYDGDWRDYATGAFFVRQLARLDDAGIPVFLINGNHDAESEITRSLRLPSNTHRLSVDAPETVVLDDVGLAVHGQGFARRAVVENLVPAYPDRIQGLVNVGMLHTSVQGDDRHDTYAPCRPDDLSGCGYEYFALGHIHEQRVVCDGPHVAAFSGNLQGRHPQETGAKGALVVDVEPGERATLTPLTLDVARWELVVVDAAGCTDGDDVLDAVESALRERCVQAAPRAVVAQVTLTGSTRAAPALTDAEWLRSEIDLLAAKAGAVVEKIRNRTGPPADALIVDPELTDAVAAAASGLVDDPDRVRELAAGLEREIGRPLREAGLLDLRDPDRLAGLARQAEQQLLAQLAGTPESSGRGTGVGTESGEGGA